MSALLNHGRTLLAIRFAANCDTFVTQRCMMKLIFEKLMPGSEAEFTFKEISSERFSCPWHYHPENEFPPAVPQAEADLALRLSERGASARAGRPAAGAVKDGSPVGVEDRRPSPWRSRRLVVIVSQLVASGVAETTPLAASCCDD